MNGWSVAGDCERSVFPWLFRICLLFFHFFETRSSYAAHADLELTKDCDYRYVPPPNSRDISPPSLPPLFFTAILGKVGPRASGVPGKPTAHSGSLSIFEALVS